MAIYLKRFYMNTKALGFYVKSSGGRIYLPKNRTGFLPETVLPMTLPLGVSTMCWLPARTLMFLSLTLKSIPIPAASLPKQLPTGSVAKFAASGKKTPKKDMGSIAMTYGYVYVASVAMGANKQQLIKALTEAESYDGPSLIIAYAPCINHGIKQGMGKSQQEEKRAVQCGYWPLYRYNPVLKAEGNNPFSLDYQKPDGSLREFLGGEVRYASLQKTFPDEAKKLHDRLEQEINQRYETLKDLADKSFLGKDDKKAA